MADQVQAALDQMVAPLKDLLDRGIFSEEEIRAIVARRRESEYLLRRRAARKADFLRYIETEMALEKLRALRARQVALRQKQQEKQKALEEGKSGQRGDGDDEVRNNNRTKTKHIGDVHIIQHVHLLFVRAIRKFKSDVTLYLQHAAFCKQAKSFSKLTRIYAEAVQVHPKNVGLWIEAASHEFFGVVMEEEDGGGKRKKKQLVVHGGGSVQNARIILQRGLRINPLSQDLWLQTFGLELHYIQKLRGREAIMMMSSERQQGTDQQDPAAITATSLPLVVFKNAVLAIPNDLAFRLKFVDLCQMFPKESVEDIQRHIMKSIRDDFASSPSAWIAWASHVANTSSQTGLKQHDNATGFLASAEADSEQKDENELEPPQKRQRSNSNSSSDSEDYTKVSNELPSSNDQSHADPVVKVLLEATNEIPSAEMFLLSAQFAQDYAASFLEPAEANANVEESVRSIHDFINQLFERSELIGIQTPELILEQVKYLVYNTKSADPCEASIKAAIKVLESFCKRTSSVTKETSKVIPCQIWIRWADLHIMLWDQCTKSSSQNDERPKQQHVMPKAALDVLRMGLNRTSMTESTHFVVLLLHMISGLIIALTQKDDGSSENREFEPAYEDELTRLFQQVLILAPGQVMDSKPLEEEVQFSEWFGPCSLSNICLHYLRLQKCRKGTQGARNTYHQVLFQHQLPLIMGRDIKGWKDFVDECVAIESNQRKNETRNITNNKQTQKHHQRLDRLFKMAANLFKETEYGIYYKQERENRLAMM